MSDFIKEKTRPKIDARIQKMRAEYRKNGIPTILDESLNLLLTVLRAKNPAKILEIGTATGMSGICMLQVAKSARLTTVEADEKSYLSARANFKEFGVNQRVNAIFSDAGDVVKYSDSAYDFIFLDGAKARYYDYLPDLDRLLNPGGVLFADNVLFRGLIESEKVPHRNMTIVRNMRAFINELCESENYETSLLNVGDGVLIAVKK
ncbi:MAG: O-methyltransferase [Candidatus Borkfalkiaceae bacterium]|nr:O-methyltransferase [Christensenellaceae bacterium]